MASSNNHGGRRPGAGRKPKQEQRDDIARFNAAKALKEESLARLRQAEADQVEGTLIPVSEVEQVVTLAFAAVAQTLLSLPDELERSVGMDPEQAEFAEKTIHNAMNGLADQLARFAPELTAPGEQAVST